MNIYLIGYRCTGKTTLGKILARQIGWSFTDMDDQIVAQAGQSISDMVERHGWPYFRKKEHELLQTIRLWENYVIGTGGGVILDDRNIGVMRGSGKVIWLRSRPETIERYIMQDQRTAGFRPSLTGKGVREEIRQTLAMREPLYQKAMNAVIDTDDFQMDRLCDDLIFSLRKLGLNI
ncbi:MAG: shikimate kinase [Desulfobacteraceae bacterium]|nr:shikimate kinase [Desulfobacteraceae bacterium]